MLIVSKTINRSNKRMPFFKNIKHKYIGFHINLYFQLLHMSINRSITSLLADWKNSTNREKYHLDTNQTVSCINSSFPTKLQKSHLFTLNSTPNSRGDFVIRISLIESKEIICSLSLDFFTRISLIESKEIICSLSFEKCSFNPVTYPQCAVNFKSKSLCQCTRLFQVKTPLI